MIVPLLGLIELRRVLRTLLRRRHAASSAARSTASRATPRPHCFADDGHVGGRLVDASAAGVGLVLDAPLAVGDEPAILLAARGRRRRRARGRRAGRGALLPRGRGPLPGRRDDRGNRLGLADAADGVVLRRLQPRAPARPPPGAARRAEARRSCCRCRREHCRSPRPLSERFGPLRPRSVTPVGAVKAIRLEPSTERCPSGLRSAIGNRVGGVNPPRGFESHPLRSVDDGNAQAPGVLAEALVEAGNPAVVVLCCQQDAAVGQFEAGLSPQTGETWRSVASEGKLSNGELLERLLRILQSTGASRRNQGLGEADLTGAESTPSREPEGAPRLARGADRDRRDERSGRSRRGRSRWPVLAQPLELAWLVYAGERAGGRVDLARAVCRPRSRLPRRRLPRAAAAAPCGRSPRASVAQRHRADR